MEVRDLWAALSHRRCTIFSGDDEAPLTGRNRAEVVWMDRRGLLVRLDEPLPEQLQRGQRVRLDVPREDGLYRVHGSVTHVLPRPGGEPMLYVDAEYGERIQLRASERFQVSYPARFTPMARDEGGAPVPVEGSRPGAGRVVDISAGGLLLETSVGLAADSPLTCQVFTPVGPLELEGEVVTSLRASSGASGELVLRYGIKFTRVQEETRRRLRKLLLGLERAVQELAAQEGAGAGRPRRPMRAEALERPRGLARRLRSRRPGQGE